MSIGFSSSCHFLLQSTIAKYLSDPEKGGRHKSQCALQICFTCAQEEIEEQKRLHQDYPLASARLEHTVLFCREREKCPKGPKERILQDKGKKAFVLKLEVKS